MSEADQRLAQGFQIGQRRKLRAVVPGDRLKDIIPMSELYAIIHGCRTFFDAPAKDPLVFMDQSMFANYFLHYNARKRTQYFYRGGYAAHIWF